MTRFLQAFFTAPQSFFVSTIRHPLGCTHLSWTYKDEKNKIPKTCGKNYIKHWLAMYVNYIKHWLAMYVAKGVSLLTCWYVMVEVCER